MYWQLDGGYIGWHTGPPGYLGLYFEGNLSQTLNTVAGQRYLLKFTTAHNRDPFVISTLQTFWDGRLVASYTFSEFGLTEQPKFLVTANGTATPLRFNASLLTGLDDVSVVPAPATQPEIVLTSPAHGANYTMGDDIALRSEVTPGSGRSIGRVDYYYNGFNLIASVSNAPYSAMWSNVPPGVWYLSASVTDSANETTTAFAAQVNVATRPTVVWSSPESDAVVAIGDNVPLSARVLYNIGTGTVTRLVFRTGSNVVQEFQGREFQGRLGNGLYTAVWTNAPEGEFTVSATVYNATGALSGVAEAKLFVLPPAVLDQSQSNSGSYASTAPTTLLAQTFTPSVNGELHHIDVPYFPAHFEETNFPVTVTVVETVSGQPSGRVLAQTTIPKANQETSAKSAFFRSNRPLLRAGQLYAFVISAPLHTWGLRIQMAFESNQYGRGAMWRKIGDGPWEQAESLNPDPDMVFETYMIPKNLAPISNAGLDRILECRGGTAGIMLDGSGSFDPYGGALRFQWYQVGSLISTGTTVRVEVPFGTNEFRLVVTDSVGLTSTDSVQVVVRDTLPPRIRNATATPAILWPKNHHMVPVQLALDVSDACDSDLRFQIVSVTSNDPQSNDESDWEITGPLSLQLRAERSGSIGDRVYTVMVAATDLSGNSSQHAVQVTVPRNRAETRPPKPRLTQHAAGAVSLDFETVPGQVYRIESSVDLIYWTPITPWLTATEERSSCLDQDAAAAPHRFYRVVVRE